MTILKELMIIIRSTVWHGKITSPNDTYMSVCIHYIHMSLCMKARASAHHPTLHALVEHDDPSSLLLPHHLPEVSQRVLEGTLGKRTENESHTPNQHPPPLFGNNPSHVW